MTLNELKSGMIVETRDGESHIIIRDFDTYGDVLAGLSDSGDISNTWSRMSGYNQDMKFPGLPGFDIVAVYKASPYCADIPKKLIWKRE